MIQREKSAGLRPLHHFLLIWECLTGGKITPPNRNRFKRKQILRVNLQHDKMIDVISDADQKKLNKLIYLQQNSVRSILDIFIIQGTISIRFKSLLRCQSLLISNRNSVNLHQTCSFNHYFLRNGQASCWL